MITIDKIAKQNFLDKYVVLAYWKTDTNLIVWTSSKFARDLTERIWEELLAQDVLTYVPAGEVRAYYKFKSGLFN